MLPGYRIARVCFIFSEPLKSNVAAGVSQPAPQNNSPISRLYAFVLWFEPISPPSPHSKLKTVQKMMVGDQQATGIVPITDIKFTCQLSPMLSKSFWDNAESQDIGDRGSLDAFDTFYVNCFGGHIDYELFA